MCLTKVEALPYYWLAVGLLNILKQTPAHQPGWNVFAPAPSSNVPGVKYGEMLKSARLFTRMGEGVSGPNAQTSSTTSSWTSGIPFGPGTDTASTGLDSTLAPGSGDTSMGAEDTTSDAIFDGIAFEDFMGQFGSVTDVLAN